MSRERKGSWKGEKANLKANMVGEPVARKDDPAPLKYCVRGQIEWFSL